MSSLEGALISAIRDLNYNAVEGLLKQFFTSGKSINYIHGITYWDFLDQHYFDGTPLHYAVYKKALNIVQLLLDYGASPNIPNFEGRTPIFYAVIVPPPQLNIVVELVKRGAKLDVIDNEGKTLLHHAVINHATNIVDYLLQYLEVRNIINIRDNYGYTALGYATKNRFNDIADLLLKYGAKS